MNMKKFLGKKNSTSLMKSHSFLQRMLARTDDEDDESSEIDSDASVAVSSRGLDSDTSVGSVGTSVRGCHI